MDPPPDGPGGPPRGPPTEILSSLSSALAQISSLSAALVTSATPTISMTTAVSSVLPAMETSDPSTDDTSDSDDSVDATTTSNLPVQVSNSISLLACILVLASYIWFRRKNKRIMERPSLVLAVSMATTDGLLHTINLFGYTNLPHNFICAFFGGFLYAWPTLISIFYSFCIALNTQLVFVFSRRPGNTKLKYYVGIPIALATVICVPALAAGVYGYDAVYDLCWIASDGTASEQVLVRYLLTFGAWCLAGMLYLIIAAVTIIHAVFSRSSKMNQLASSLSRTLASSSPLPSNTTGGIRPSSRYSSFQTNTDPILNQNAHPTAAYPSPAPHEVTFYSLKSEFEDEPPTPTIPQRPTTAHSVKSRNIHAQNSGLGSHPPPRQRNATLSRRSLAMRALAFRLLGYILIPTICILPGVVIDLITKVSPDAAANIPDSLSTAFDTINGLVGLFNALLYALDPALLALYYQIRMARRERRMQRRSESGAGEISGEHSGDVEMTATRTGFTVYSTPPETPGAETPTGFGYGEKPGDGGTTSQDDNKTDLGNGTKVEVRSGRFLSPLHIGKRLHKTDLGLPSPRTTRNAASPGMGVVIRVEVEVNDDRDQELARLERYLGGL